MFMHGAQVEDTIKLVFHHPPNFPKSTLFCHFVLFIYLSGGFPGASNGKEVACNARDLGSTPGLGRSPGEGNGTYSSILAGEIPWNGSLQFMGLQRIEHDWVTKHTHTYLLGLHCVACRIFPNQESNSGPQQWKHGVLTTGPPGNSLFLFVSH